MVQAQAIGSLQRGLLGAVALLGPLVYSRRMVDIFQLPKLTLIVVGAGLLLVLVALEDVRRARVVLPAGVAVAVAAVFLGAVVVATVTSDATGVSILGAYRRGTGALLYVGCAVLFVGVCRAYDPPGVRRLLFALLGGAGAVLAYALIQRFGVDPVPWQMRYGPHVHATLGNPNFAAGFLAVATPLVMWAAWEIRRAPIRIAALPAAAVLLGLALHAAGSNQGPVAAAAGLGILALGWLLEQRGTVRRVGLLVWGAGAGLATIVLAAGVAGAGPLRALGEAHSFVLRTHYWRAALAMAADHPILGVGMDMYGLRYREYRPLEAALQSPLAAANDAAHSVPLAMLSSGGLLLGLAYLAFVVCVGAILVRGLLRTHGAQRRLLAAAGGGWAAYQVQSLVSIDIPPLALAHWLLAGVVVVAAGSVRQRSIDLPWAPLGRSARTRARQGWLTAGAGVVALGVLFVGTLPLRADLAAKRGELTTRAGDHERGLDAFREAQRLAPWQGEYWFEEAKAHVDTGDITSATAAFMEAARRQGGELGAPLSAARGAAHVGDVELAAALYQTAYQMEPKHPSLKVELARFAFNRGDPTTAERLLQAALDVAPEHQGARRLAREMAGEG